MSSARRDNLTIPLHGAEKPRRPPPKWSNGATSINTSFDLHRTPMPPCNLPIGHTLKQKEFRRDPVTRNRVPVHTSASVNRRIEQETEKRVQYYSRHPSEVDSRLRALNREWDIERAIEMNASALAFVGTSLGALRNRNWLILPALVTGFLFQQAVQGWCPPVPILRRLGFRTIYEIEQERRELLTLRDSRSPRARTFSRTKRRSRARSHKAAGLRVLIL